MQFNDKSSYDCAQIYKKKLSHHIKKGKWHPEDDVKLCVGVKIFGKGAWSKVAQCVRDRDEVKCRERYCNILDPSLKSMDWNEEENSKLLQLVDKYGMKWASIAKRMANRTDNHCWR